VLSRIIFYLPYMNTMSTTEAMICKNCGATGSGKHCYQCGQKLQTERLTLHTILHEVFHYFTHVDKGFGYTFKQLAVRPGSMQKEFVEGMRANHQKPFSMFFLCGTISGLGYYFINLAYQNIHQRDSSAEADFFRHYFVLLQALLMPVYTLVLWALFKNEKKNYAEILVLCLYSFSFVFIVLIFINAVKLIFPDYENRYVEVAFLLAYNNITNLRFFSGKRWAVIAKTVVMLAFSFTLSQVMIEAVLNWFE
jgi:hypothetical protein